MGRGDINLRVDEFLTNTRVPVCEAVECIYHSDDGYTCKLKEIYIERNGECLMYERRGAK